MLLLGREQNPRNDNDHRELPAKHLSNRGRCTQQLGVSRPQHIDSCSPQRRAVSTRRPEASSSTFAPYAPAGVALHSTRQQGCLPPSILLLVLRRLASFNFSSVITLKRRFRVCLFTIQRSCKLCKMMFDVRYLLFSMYFHPDLNFHNFRCSLLSRR